MKPNCVVEQKDGLALASLPVPTTIVIPAYNEARHLEQVVRGCFAVAPSVVVVVDDASTDDTPRVLSLLKGDFGRRLVVLRNARNVGKQGSVVDPTLRIRLRLHGRARAY